MIPNHPDHAVKVTVLVLMGLLISTCGYALHQEKEKLYVELKHILARQPGPEAAEQLHRAAGSGEYAVLFIDEELAAAIEQDVARYKDVPLPAITVLPGKNGSKGYGAAAIKNAMERAIGADIL